MNRIGIAVFAGLLIALLVTGALAQDDDPKQLKKRLQNWEDSALDAHGGTNRRGDEFKQLGGPHGPFGPGPDDLQEKDTDVFFSDGGEDSPAGQMLQHSWGPGDSSLEPPCGPIGPNEDGDGFGPGESAGDGEPSADGSRAQSRTGRR